MRTECLCFGGAHRIGGRLRERRTPAGRSPLSPRRVDVRVSCPWFRAARAAQVRLPHGLEPGRSVGDEHHGHGLYGRVAADHRGGPTGLGHARRHDERNQLHQRAHALGVLVPPASGQRRSHRREHPVHAGIQEVPARDLVARAAPGNDVRHHGRVPGERTVQDRDGLCSLGFRGRRSLGRRGDPRDLGGASDDAAQPGQDQYPPRRHARVLSLDPPVCGASRDGDSHQRSCGRGFDRRWARGGRAAP